MTTNKLLKNQKLVSSNMNQPKQTPNKAGEKITLEQQVTSLELSKKLKKLGIKKPKDENNAFFWSMTGKKINGEWEYELDRVGEFPAYLASELFDYIYSTTKASFFIYHNAGKYLLQYGMSQGNYQEEKLADCLADYILDQKIL